MFRHEQLWQGESSYSKHLREVTCAPLSRSSVMRLLGDAAWFGAALLLYLRSLLALHTGAARLILDRLHLLNSKAVGLPGVSQSTVLPPAQVESSVCVMLTGYRFVCGIFPAYLKQVLVLDSVGCQVKWPFRCPSSKRVSGQMVLCWCCSC